MARGHAPKTSNAIGELKVGQRSKNQFVAQVGKMIVNTETHALRMRVSLSMMFGIITRTFGHVRCAL